jgi:hypothetical protein
VEELGGWMSEKIAAHPCFERLTAEELEAWAVHVASSAHIACETVLPIE